MEGMIMVPGSSIVQKMAYEVWEKDKKAEGVEWINELFEALDQCDESYKKYQVHWPEVEYGSWSIEHHTIPKHCWERILHVASGPTPVLDRDTGWGDITVLKKDGVVWMSDTRAEIMEHSPLINKLFWLEPIRPTVLINGLGLGMAVNAALKHGASHIDVVEIDPEVIAVVGPNFDKEVHEGRVTIHHADAYDMTWAEDKRWNLAWHDIWVSISDTNLPGMAQLAMKYRDRVLWQESWQQQTCKQAYRLGRQLVRAMESGDWDRVKQLDPDF